MLLPAFLVFFVSGFAALLYQVVWQRLLVIFSGADVYSATLVVTAFMAGLGIGNLAGGHVADRVSPRASLILFGIAELAVAGFGALSVTLYYDVLYQRFGHVDFPAGALAAILLVSLLWPTFFMGASLPLLSRALTRHISGAAATIGGLFGLNTLGAATGALLATWWLLPMMGMEQTLRVGALMNLACALVVLPMAFVIATGRPEGRPLHVTENEPLGVAGREPAGADLQVGPDLPFWMWASIYAFTGFLALSLEIVWFRLLGVMMKSTAFTFGTLLALYLGGLGLGAVAGSVAASTIRRPAAAFLATQAAGGLSACVLLAALVARADRVDWLISYFASYEPLAIRDEVANLAALFTGSTEPKPSVFLRLYVGLPALLIVPPTFLMGASFPLIQRAVQTDLARVGRRVGHLLLANIAGSMLGTVLTGWVALDVLGTAVTLRVLAALSGLLGIMAVVMFLETPPAALRWRTAARAAAAVAIAAGLVALILWLPDGRTLWARLHGAAPRDILAAEDGSGLSVIKTKQDGVQGKIVVYVNGLGQSGVPYGDIHTALGALPAFVHPNPVDAAVIGLGSGDTVHAVAGRQEIERIECIEIIRPQLPTLSALSQRFPYGGLTTMLSDRRIQHIFGDGRLHLRRGGRRYDIIEADALRPGSAYSGNLYSDAYFELVRDHLKPNGLAATWPPTQRVANTFLRAFPYVVSLPGVLLGSREPIRIDREEIRRRISAPAVREYYARAGIDIARIMEDYLTQPAVYGADFDRRALLDVNTDLFPRDEYDLGY